MKYKSNYLILFTTGVLLLFSGCSNGIREGEYSQKDGTYDYHRAHTAYIHNDMHSAAEHIQHALQQNAHFSPSLLLAGKIAYFRGNTEQALYYFRRLYNAETNHNDAAWWLAHLLIQQQQYENAQAVLAQTLQSASQNPLLLAQMAHVYAAQNHTDTAIELYERALLFAEHIANAAVQLAHIYQQAGLQKRALTTYQQAWHLLPENSGAKTAVRTRIQKLTKESLP